MSTKLFAKAIDTSYSSVQRQVLLVDSLARLKENRPLFVVDGMIEDSVADKINAQNLLQTYLLKPPESTNIYGEAGKNGTLLISTLEFGAVYCRRKLSELSFAYRYYMALNKNDDSGLVYILNGVVLNGEESRIVRKLYDQIEKIKAVIFVEKFSKKLDLNNPKPIVVITTAK
jgi:hypothetical protein